MVTLHDGRTLEYADLGDPAGRPVVFFPGTPATAAQGAVVADAARVNGVRLVAVSRPGYGASTNTPPGLTSAAADAVELADQLGVERFVAMGVSGGAPYALAAAALAPDRVSSVAVLGGPGSHAEVNPEDLDDDDRRALAMIADGDVDDAIALETAAADNQLAGLRGLSTEEFAAAFRQMAPPGPNWFDDHPDSRPAFNADFQRGITTSEGYVRDNVSWLGPWDFDLAAVTVPVRLVYGESDRMVPSEHGEWLRERLADSEMHVVPGGHGHATFGAAEETFAILGAE
ncbi:MAG TPA: alpha/beta hydrolase [Nocardioides sp.]|uniref:alpha/beta fold hydrolase n=1 Tax=Nocardioides sp. TaxID=35761 RepID=UPI002F3E6647